MKKKQEKKIYLASTSKIRHELLEKLGIDFESCLVDYDEDMSLDLSPAALAHELSRGKAFSAIKNKKEGLIIAADTFVMVNNELLGKPKNDEEARKMLEKISGKTIFSYTGITVLDIKTKKHSSNHCLTELKIKSLNKDEMKNYIESKEPIGKAGAFAIQGLGSLIIEEIKGDYYSIVGLPLFTLHNELSKFGIKLI